MQGKFKHLPRALASIMALCLPVAEAGETVDLGKGVKFDWSLSTIYALGVRTKSPNPLLASDDTNFTGNDGNNNFQKGSITTNRRTFREQADQGREWLCADWLNVLRPVVSPSHRLRR